MTRAWFAWLAAGVPTLVRSYDRLLGMYAYCISLMQSHAVAAAAVSACAFGALGQLNRTRPPGRQTNT